MSKTRKIIGWSLTILLAAFLLFVSAPGKFMTLDDETKKYMLGLGVDTSNKTIIGILEIVSVLLFVFPRTGVIGTLMLTSYLGGAMATHITHGDMNIGFQIVFIAIVWITSVIRFPEITHRLLGK